MFLYARSLRTRKNPVANCDPTSHCGCGGAEGCRGVPYLPGEEVADSFDPLVLRGMFSGRFNPRTSNPNPRRTEEKISMNRLSTHGGINVPPPQELSPFHFHWTRADYLENFQKITQQMLQLTEAKSADYASDSDPFANFRTFGELGILVRMSDKFARLKTALVDKKEMSVSKETIEDTILDLATYAVLLLSYRRGA